MNTRNKCLFSLSGLFLVEILPMPFTAFIGLYVAAKRPRWFYSLIDRLYTEDADNVPDFALEQANPQKTRRKCLYSLAGLTAVDAIIPVILPLAFFITLKKPQWFLRTTQNLYADSALDSGINARQASKLQEKQQNQRLTDIQQRNLEFAHEIAHRQNLSGAKNRSSKR